MVSKFESLVNFHVAEMVTAIQVGKIEADKRQVIIYSTIDGRIAVLYPFEPE